jgi:hypothetical protein
MVGVEEALDDDIPSLYAVDQEISIEEQTSFDKCSSSTKIRWSSGIAITG